MCVHVESPKSWYNPNLVLFLALLVGLAAGWWQSSAALVAANAISHIFINLLRLVSLPIIFLSLLSTASGMESVGEAKRLGWLTLRYTLMTTLAAATVALGLFLLIDPVGQNLPIAAPAAAPIEAKSYIAHLLDIVPSNFLKPFVENNVIGVMFLAILFSLSILALPLENRQLLHRFFHSLLLAVMKLTSWILLLMPVAVFAFAALFAGDLRAGLEIESLGLYLLCILLANVLQAVVVLPAFLKAKGISPLAAAKGMFPALSIAFFTKSSAGTLPTALVCATERMGIDRKVANFTLPLCTSINMNGCAAFILITVLFVSMSHGVAYAPWELVLWIFIATLAAIGNASVPMGCFFLSSALLVGMDIPLHLLGIILPFYTFIDMLETSINVWSDGCVAAAVDADLKASASPSLSMSNGLIRDLKDLTA